MAEISKQALKVANNTSFPDNNVGDITPSDLRGFNTDVIDSTVNQTSFNAWSASVTSSIQQLSAFTASQQPSFAALNNFTASQLNINTGLNAATYSLDARLDSAESNLTDLNTWSQSVNQISDNGIVQGYSTRLHFYGLVSASIVPNVNGAIASILIEQDGTKANTASFNSFTASTNARLNDIETWSGSAKISIAALNSFTASVGPIQTGSLLVTSSFADDKLTFTKGNGAFYSNVGIQNTASFNAYTASALTSLNSFTASANISITNLNAFTSSQNTKNATLLNVTASLNQFTASASGRLNSLESTSASVIISLTNINAFTASIAGTNLFTASINTYTASNNTKWTTIGLLTGSYATTGSNTFTGSQVITGSVQGNVTALSITSNTASLDFNSGNFFTLTLANNTTTHIKPTNIKTGQTVNLLITQGTAGTASFSSEVKFPAGFGYTASVTNGNQDLISLVTFNTQSVYAAAVKNLI